MWLYLVEVTPLISQIFQIYGLYTQINKRVLFLKSFGFILFKSILKTFRTVCIVLPRIISPTDRIYLYSSDVSVDQRYNITKKIWKPSLTAT